MSREVFVVGVVGLNVMMIFDEVLGQRLSTPKSSRTQHTNNVNNNVLGKTTSPQCSAIATWEGNGVFDSSPATRD